MRQLLLRQLAPAAALLLGPPNNPHRNRPFCHRRHSLDDKRVAPTTRGCDAFGQLRMAQQYGGRSHGANGEGRVEEGRSSHPSSSSSSSSSGRRPRQRRKRGRMAHGRRLDDAAVEGRIAPNNRRRGSSRWDNRRAARSREVLLRFEEACRRSERSEGEGLVSLLESMVHDLLLSEGSDDNSTQQLLLDSANIATPKRVDGKLCDSSADSQSIGKDATTNDGAEETIERNQCNNNLSHLILPRDASSIIRLLGRNLAHDAMLRFCRRYCRDVVAHHASGGSEGCGDGNNNGRSSSSSSNSSSNNNSNRNNTGGGDIKMGRDGAEKAVLYAYTAAIAALTKPPPASLAASLEPKEVVNYYSTVSARYRRKSFLLSLLEEMETGYTTTEGGEEEGDARTIRPNSYTLSAVLLGIDDSEKAYRLLQYFEEKYRIVGQGGSPEDKIVTVQVYNVVLASCSRRRRSSERNDDDDDTGWQRAISILQKMRRSGPAPDERTYSMVLRSCAEHGQMKVALSLLEEIRRSSSPSAAAARPSLKLYVPLLKACADAGDYKTARSVVDMMESDSLMPTTEIMNLYLASLARAGGMHVRALGVLHDMIAADPSSTVAAAARPDLVTFNTVLSACANAGDYEGARALLDGMSGGLYAFPAAGGGRRPKNDLVEVRPDVVSYNTVIKCAPPEDALSLIEEMRLTRRRREGVVTPNAVTYVNAISQCRKASLVANDTTPFDIAMYLLELARSESSIGGRGVDLNVYVYSSSIWMAEAVGDYRTAVQLLREMTCAPNRVCYDGVISALANSGLHREALYFFYEMREKGLDASRKTYQKLVYAIDNAVDASLSNSPQRKAALLDGVLSVMPERDRKVQVGGPLFHSLIKNHGLDSSYQNAKRVYYSIVGPVDDACLSAMLRVCSSTNPPRWKEAIQFLHTSDIVTKSVGRGLVSKRSLSNAVIACAKADQIDEALTLIELYGNRKADSQSSIVSLAAVNALISCCGRSSRPDMAVELLNDMSVRFGVAPDEISYRLAVIACNQAEHRERRSEDPPDTGPELAWWECALSLLRRMKEDGITPSTQTYSSAVSACEAAGQWQRALGVLQSMPSFSIILGNDDTLDLDGEFVEPPNLYCLNAAISACEKGGAWVEALQLYESIRSNGNESVKSVTPNFVTVNSLLIALEKANQIELSEDIYAESVRDKIVRPWKRRYDSDGKLRKMLDLHQFSAPMAKIAVRSYVTSLLSSKKSLPCSDDAVFITGKGRRSEEKPVLQSTIIQLLCDEFGINAHVDEENAGRVRIPKASIETFVEEMKWDVVADGYNESLF